MNQLRKVLQEMNDCMIAMSRAFSAENHEANKDAYEKFRDCIAIAQLLGCKTTVSETWENDFVICEVEIEGVKW